MALSYLSWQGGSGPSRTGLSDKSLGARRRISKSGSLFCFPERIYTEMRRIFGGLKDERLLRCLDAETDGHRAPRDEAMASTDTAEFDRSALPFYKTSMSDTISPDDEHAHHVDALVRSGRYADRREAVQAPLEALRDRDETIERWLREAVLPVAAETMADPSHAIPIEEVIDDIRRHHAARMAANVRDA